MFIRCMLFLFLIGPITAVVVPCWLPSGSSRMGRHAPYCTTLSQETGVKWQLCCRISSDYRFVSSSGSCAIPKLNNGKVKVRGRSRIVRFICSPGYTLVGNKYTTCRNGHWDVQIPVCIRTGCTPIPLVENRIQIPSYDTAWLIFFCLPGYELKGSESIYCDGKNWNASAPTCVDITSKSKVKQQLSCTFEEPDICGWTNSDLHDFDWQRFNEATPSSFLKTGPSYDHTLGKGKSGYYMYIESTSRYEKDVAWLLSPIYDRSLLKDGCFSFFYHMYGNGTGGLKVYIKPVFLDLNQLMKPGDLNKKYNLVEKWGNKGDFWLNSVTTLPDVEDNFQIVIEGIRGSSYTSDIAIDDVAILQGSNCTAALAAATTPTAVYPDSCLLRCFLNNTVNNVGCSCSSSCVLQNDCCVDFFDVCIFDPDSSGEAATVSDIVPQTQKLIATTPETTSTSIATSTPITTTTTTTTTPKPTTTSTTTTTTTTPRTTIKTTQKATTITTNTKPTTTRRPPITKPVAKTTKTTIVTTKKITTIPTTTKATTLTIKTIPYTTSTTTTTKPTKRTTHFPYGISRTIENHNDYHDILEKAKKEKEVELRNIGHLQSHGTQKNGSSGWKVLLIIISIVACMGSVSWLVLVARTSRGRETIARLRGHIIHDPEVRFLSTDVDDD